MIRTGEPVLYADVDEAALEAIGGRPEQVEMLRRLGAALGDGRAHRRPAAAPWARITLGATHSGRRYTPADLAFAATLGERVGLAVDNARVFREAQEANRMKDEFLATLSHELRTPLNAIVGWAHVLRGGPLDKAVVARAVDTIDRNARTQTQLISDILDVSRIVTGKLRLSVGPVELPAVVEAALEAARPAAAAKEIRIEAEIDPLAGPVSGDADRLQQVVGNLLANAIKFTPKGGRVKRAPRRGSTVRGGDRGRGHRRGHRARVPAPAVRALPPARRLDHAAPRRHRPRAGHRAPPRRAARRPRWRRTSGGRGQGATFRVRLPLLGMRGSVLGSRPGLADARPARGARGARCPRSTACACSSWTTRRTRAT